jgi:long-chain acyl-CoA synthetase
MQSHESHRVWLDTYPDWLPAEVDIKTAGILEAFLRSADARPQSACIHYFDHTYSFQQIRQWSLRLAGAMERLAVGPGDRVMVIVQNIPQSVIACLAAWMRGAVVVPLNPMFTGNDLKHYLEDSGAVMVVCQDDLYPDKVETAVQGRDRVHVVTTSALDLLPGDAGRPAQLGGLKKMSFERTRDFMDLIGPEGWEAKEVLEPGPGDLAYLVYTSGTTGPAKGALVRHGNVMHNAVVYEKACRMDQSDVVLGVAPLFHITGIVAHVAIAFHLGIPIILAGRFDPGETLRLIEKYGATFTVAAITVYIALLNHPGSKQHDLSHFKKAYSGGAPVSPGTVRKFRDAMGLTIYNVYGLTESTSPATITPLGMTGPVDEQSGALSVGLVIPGHDAWIVDLEDPLRELPPGAEGELVLKGPGITDGYWQKPRETAEAIRNGRFHTGDVAKLDAKGWCYIVDRKKDLINVSGFKVWPRDVEDVLYQHPAVKEAAVVGVPDPYRGENVKAFVSLTPEAMERGDVSPESLIAFCKERMAAYKYPRIVQIIEEVPKTLSGKFLRRQLRDL